MFVSPQSAGMGESTSKKPAIQQPISGEGLLQMLQNVHITSHTGLTERRNLIRSWTTEELLRAHTALRSRITLAGLISYADRVLLEAMKKEGTEAGGHHTGAIQISGTQKITHGQGLATTDSQGSVLAGKTQLSVWSLISNTL